MATNMTVCAVAAQRSARLARAARIDAQRARDRPQLPTATTSAIDVPLTPLPGDRLRIARTGDKLQLPRSRAPPTIAAASGCSLTLLEARGQPRAASVSSNAGRRLDRDERGLPSVSVPVLSTTSVVTFSSISSASALRNSTPGFARRGRCRP